MPSMTVYVPARDWKTLEAEGKDPQEWIRGLVKEALKRKREKEGA